MHYLAASLWIYHQAGYPQINITQLTLPPRTLKITFNTNTNSYTMASEDHVSDSETSEASLILMPDGKDGGRAPSQTKSDLSHRFREPSVPSQKRPRPDKIERAQVAVIVPAPSRPWEYLPYDGTTTVDAVLGESKNASGETWYNIVYEDGQNDDVSIWCLMISLFFAVEIRITLSRDYFVIILATQ